MTSEEFNKELKRMDRRIKREITAAKKLPSLAEKVAAHRKLAALRKARFEFQLSYFEVVQS